MSYPFFSYAFENEIRNRKEKKKHSENMSTLHG